ncbi:class I SAM-dependent methyltransferase [Halococcus agarilyticus]|uniref:class I SAM-dependent methyltransferase n=1 Tax=Halococcus agarilyticus TaxID=1232219 RepID=UPI001E4E6A89|nr:class I SAM-dependent methyltransferase [Halococcus agarilyticus]
MNDSFESVPMTDRKNAIRRAYDAIADDYLDERSAEPPATPLLDDFADRLPAGARVLDAGCGAGTPIAARLASSLAVVGVDFSIEQVRRARENVPEARFAQGDMTHLSFAADSFDAICALYSLIHVPMDDHPRVVREFHRVLRPGGLVLLSIGSEEWDGSNPDWLDTGVEMHWSFPDPETSIDHLTGAGFEILERHTVEDELGGAFPILLAKNPDP